MRRTALVVLAALAAGSTPLAAQHTANPWTVRTRAIAIVPNASSAPAGLDVKSSATLEVDISRALNDYLALELILATGTQEVTAGTTSLGSVVHVPPTLLLQFTPVPRGSVHPYIGGGVNTTFFVQKSGDLKALDLTTSFGWAAQAGFDFDITPRALFNIDAKYAKIGTDVKSGATTAYKLDIDPFVFGVGLGYRF